MSADISSLSWIRLKAWIMSPVLGTLCAAKSGGVALGQGCNWEQGDKNEATNKPRNMDRSSVDSGRGIILYSGILLLLGSSKCSKNAVSHEHVTVCSAQQSLCGRKRMADKFYP